MKWFLAGLLLAAVIAVGGFGTAQAQENPPPAPPNLVAVNGANPGEVSLTWTAVPGVSSYRIGWLADEDYQAYPDLWREKFAYSDVTADAAYTLARLTPGIKYYLIIGRKQSGRTVWSDWVALTLNNDQSSCPAVETPDPTPTPQPTPTPTRGPVTGGDYDADDDGLIEIRNLAQLHAIRWDLDGNGSPVPRYADAFPDAMPGMGCPSGCMGYELVADLDFDTNGNGEADAGDAYWNEGEGWVPIGDESRNFNTVFDGNGHKISNLYNKERYLGLFGTTGVASKIRRVGLVSVSMSSRCIGCGPQGSLVATNHGSISDSYVTGSVSGLESVGGLVGLNLGTITSSYSTSEVNGYTWPDVGGLVGENRGTISASYATGNVSSSGDRVGSLVGTNSGTIIASYATGDVSTRYEEIGGLVGRNLRTIIASYAVGNVSGSETTGYIGGLVGLNNGSITHSYWNTQTAGLNYSDGGVGKNTDELRSPTGYTGIYADWDVDVDQDGINDDPWDFGTSSQYPVLKYGGLSVAEQR